MNTKLPFLRFNQFHENWNIVNLKDKALIYDGTHQTPKYENKGVPFVSVESIENIDITSKFISPSAFEKDFKIKPQKDDILMTRITAGVIGKTAIVKNNNPLAYYVSLALIRIKDDDINVNFLNQVIKSSSFRRELHKRIIHIAFPKKINLNEIGYCKISFCSLPEQTKIASFLTTVDEKIAGLKKQLTLLERYKKGVMQKIFPSAGSGKPQELRFQDENGNEFPDWEEKKLGEISRITTGSSNRIDSNLHGEYTFFDRSQDIRSSNRFLFDTEAIIVPGEGQEFIPKHFVGKFDLHQRTYAIMNFQPNFGKFLYYYIGYNSNHLNSQAVGSTVKSLRLPMFERMPISLPSLPEQQKIATFLSSIDEKIEKCQGQIKAMENWKKGLLQQMFC